MYTSLTQNSYTEKKKINKSWTGTGLSTLHRQYCCSILHWGGI